MRRRLLSKPYLIAYLIIGIILSILFWNCLPEPLFRTSTSTVLEDRKGNLLGALVAPDGQWRFPYSKEVSPKFKQCIITFEDKRFYHHPGVDPLALGRAMWQHISFSKSKSGGSTLTTQVIRLARDGKKRTVWQKAIEMIMALRLECSYSKQQILELYASNAPFGSNVVGLDAAAWRYYGKSQEHLSWGETATLAVLPNSPSLVHPGKNQKILERKRNKLLEKLYRTGAIDSLTYALSMAEPLPGKPYAVPQLAPHLLSRAYLDGKKKTKGSLATVDRCSLDKDLQLQVSHILLRHHGELKGNGINNAAALVADVETGEVLAYTGNVVSPNQRIPESDVDIITAPRSTGSILKPMLFAAMLNEGELLPNTLVPDIPTQIAGYVPKNFNKEYDGAVPARRALERSLNIPAVRMLRTYGVDKFHYQLQKMGMTTLNKPADHYGLSLILGGAEGSMWDIAGVYASMARTLNHYTENKGNYNRGDFHPLTYLVPPANSSNTKQTHHDAPLLSASSIWCTFNAMEEVSRPDMESNWRDFSSSQRVAWKTGTSFGFRDGWAVGCTPKYVVIVWVGNADGEGRPGLTGIATAAPIMFDIFKLLRSPEWFEQPYGDMQQVEVCTKSGYRAMDICEEKELAWIPAVGQRTAPCPFHQLVHLDATGKYRVSSDCEAPNRMQHQSWFVLPPAQEWYYKSRNPQYKVLPPYRADYTNLNKQNAMEFIYPRRTATIYVPVELDGKTGKAIFEVAHRVPDAMLYWHLDEEYLGYTKNFHQMALSPPPGKHLVTVIDEQGERLEMNFEILGK